MKGKMIRQAELSSECWGVQFGGLSACVDCIHADTPDCGGEQIRKTGRNELGFRVPLGEGLEKEET